MFIVCTRVAVFLYIKSCLYFCCQQPLQITVKLHTRHRFLFVIFFALHFFVFRCSPTRFAHLLCSLVAATQALALTYRLLVLFDAKQMDRFVSSDWVHVRAHMPLSMLAVVILCDIINGAGGSKINKIKLSICRADALAFTDCTRTSLLLSFDT